MYFSIHLYDVYVYTIYVYVYIHVCMCECIGLYVVYTCIEACNAHDKQEVMTVSL